MASHNPYTTPVSVTIRRVLTQNPNWIGGEEPEILIHRFADLQEAYLFCVKEAGLEESQIRGDTDVDIDDWNILPFSRLKEIMDEHESVEAFFWDPDDGDYISMSLCWTQ